MAAGANDNVYTIDSGGYVTACFYIFLYVFKSLLHSIDAYKPVIVWFKRDHLSTFSFPHMICTVKV